MQSDYAYSAFGGVYCFFTDKFAAYQLYEKAIHSQRDRGLPAEPEQSVWDLAFNGTRWQYPAAPINQMWYPCCSTFFTQGRAVTRAPRREYERVLDNILESCRTRDWAPGRYDAKGFGGNGPAGRVMEGAWHLMFAGTTNVTIPPYCKVPPRQSSPVCSPSPIVRAGRLKRRLCAQVNEERSTVITQAVVPAGLMPRGRRLRLNESNLRIA